MLSQRGHRTKRGSVPVLGAVAGECGVLGLTVLYQVTVYGILFPTSDGRCEYFDVARVRITGTIVGQSALPGVAKT